MSAESKGKAIAQQALRKGLPEVKRKIIQGSAEGDTAVTSHSALARAVVALAEQGPLQPHVVAQISDIMFGPEK